ncbi:MAG: hypothetical protein JXA33_19405 [Anaerolineae bacterium]|nr:hypothetical protein [Anaerolineae bacterium]
MKRTIVIGSGVLVLMLVLAGGAYFGARMLHTPEPAASGDGSGRMMQIVSDTGNGPIPMSVNFTQAPELPERSAEIAGIFIRRQDNSIIVGTGNIMIGVGVNEETGERTIDLNADGPEIEIVLTHDTVIYKETTEWTFDANAKSENGEIVVPQTVTRTELPETLEGNIEFQIWGEKRGDRVIAEVLVYREVTDW